MTSVESPTSPNSKTKAQQGAEIAARAAQHAARLQDKARADIHAAALQDLKLPCAAVSPSGFQAERVRTVPANVVQGSPWCDPGRLWRPTELGCPAAPNAPDFEDLLGRGLTALSLHGRPVDMLQAQTLAALLGPASRLRALDLSKALHEEPAVPAHLLDAAVGELAAQFPPPRDEEDTEATEKLQQAVEKAKGEFTTYEAALKFLARKRLDRTAALIAALSRNKSLTDLNLSNNQLGAPRGEEGKANMQPLRRLGKMLDVNTTINFLDLCGNRFGPAGCGIVAKALCKNIGVHTLDLSGNDIVGEPADEEEDPEQEEEDPVFGEIQPGLEGLSEVLKKNKFLRTISLAGNRIKGEIDEAGEDDGADTPFGKFLEPLGKYHRLTVLDLAGNELGAAGARMVADALLHNQSVTVLDLSDNQLGPRGLHHVARLLAGSEYLTTLHLQKNDGAGKKSKRAHKEALQVAAEFAAALAKNATLTDLDLSANNFGADVCAALIDGIAQARALRTLSFDSNALCGPYSTEFHPEALNLLINALAQPTSQITTLRIAANNLLAAGCQALAEAPAALSRLTVLDIARNEIGNAGAAAISTAIRDLGAGAALAELNLAYNAIDDCRAVSQMLRVTGALTSLNLAHNNLGTADPSVVEELLDAVGGRPLVQRLDLSSNKLHSAHARLVCSFCKIATPPFESLNLFDNPGITLDEATRIVQSLKNNRSIRSLRLSSQHGDPTSLIDAINFVLDTNRFVTDIDLCLPVDVTDEIVNSIRARLLRNALSNAQR